MQSSLLVNATLGRQSKHWKFYCWPEVFFPCCCLLFLFIIVVIWDDRIVFVSENNPTFLAELALGASALCRPDACETRLLCWIWQSNKALIAKELYLAGTPPHPPTTSWPRLTLTLLQIRNKAATIVQLLVPFIFIGIVRNLSCCPCPSPQSLQTSSSSFCCNLPSPKTENATPKLLDVCSIHPSWLLGVIFALSQPRMVAKWTTLECLVAFSNQASLSVGPLDICLRMTLQ